MKLSEIKLAKPEEEAEGTFGWWIVKIGPPDIGASGPYHSVAQAKADCKFKEWYKPSTHDVAFGWVDEDNGHEFHEQGT